MAEPDAAPPVSLSTIAEQEHALDLLLRDRKPDQSVDPAIQPAIRAWSAAVWAVAERLGPAVLEPGEVARGLALAQCPVIVCGAARSGTTLLRDLLDGHPELAVIPTETSFYVTLERATFGMRPDLHCGFLGSRWLERLVAPPPCWLLGRSDAQGSPYVTFARRFMAWWELPERHAQARHRSWPLAALALAYAQHQGGGRIAPGVRRWVKKTPSSERFLERVWQDFPEARALHIIRHPRAMFASLKALSGDRWSYRAAAARCLRFLHPCYRIAAANAGGAAPERYRLIRYEELAADPVEVMGGIAAFLGIEASASLLQPTIAGRPAPNNSSFPGSRPRAGDSLDWIERFLLAGAVSRAAARLGYRLDDPPHSARHSVIGGGRPA